MKRCPRCREHRELAEFHLNRARRDGHQSVCKSCRSALDRERYLRRNPEARRITVYRNNASIEWVRSLKVGRLCTDCGSTYPPQAMQWDHLPGTKKIADVSSMRATRERVLEEIAKCELVCANCHILRTVHRAGWLIREEVSPYDLARAA